MAEIVRLQTRPDRVKRETAAEIRQLILAYPACAAERNRKVA